jgi:hypothetical protein
MDNFDIGNFEWDDWDLEGLGDPNVDLGASFNLTYHQENDDGYNIEIKTPKWASTTPLKLMCCQVGSLSVSGGAPETPPITHTKRRLTGSRLASQPSPPKTWPPEERRSCKTPAHAANP